MNNAEMPMDFRPEYWIILILLLSSLFNSDPRFSGEKKETTQEKE